MKLDHIIACSASALCIAFAGCAQYSDYPGPRSSAGAESAASKTALRARSGQTRQQVFDQIDANRDGIISRAEAEASPELVAIFVTMDANSDGSLSGVKFALVPITFGNDTVGGTAGAGSGSEGLRAR